MKINLCFSSAAFLEGPMELGPLAIQSLLGWSSCLVTGSLEYGPSLSFICGM